MDTRGQTKSPWIEQVPKLNLPSLKENLSCDVCVVGGGIAGLTTAYLAAKAGKSVIVVEAQDIAGGETGRTTAHFVTAHDNRYSTLIRYHGLAKTRLVVQSLVEAISLVERIVQDEKIDCGFERLDGYLYLHPSHSEKVLDKELRACQRVGLEGVQKVGRCKVGAVDVGPALVFPNQAQLHITQYLTGLCSAIQSLGGKIFTQTRVASIMGKGPYQVHTDSGAVVTAKAVVQATNSPLYANKLQFLKQPPMRTYVLGATIPKGSVPHQLFWDTGDPYHYTRVLSSRDSDTELLLVGGEDHRTGTANDAADRFTRIEQWSRAHFPQIQNIEFQWSGQVLESIDGLAFIGEYKKMPGVFYITGDSGMGMTHGTIGAMILAETLQGKKHAWANVYAPSRLRLKAGRPWIKEAWALTWELCSGWLWRPGKSVNGLQIGEGRVIKQGKKRLAVHKDRHGKIHARSAVCPHMKCIVNWNTGEQSWDCPCHGSRFDAQGKIISAPTLGHLPPRKLK